MDLLTSGNFGLFVIIVAPGFLSMKIWGLLLPSRHMSMADSLYEAIFYGVLNYFIIVQWFPPLIKAEGCGTFWFIVSYIVSLVIIPILLPIAWKQVISSAFLKRKIINPIPKAWDVFFGRRNPCFMIVHLKDNSVIGGYYGYKSAASSYPETEDLYLEQIWQLDVLGHFKEPIEDTAGLLVSSDSIGYIELFHSLEEGEKNV
jgi:hypothetical protein